MNQQFTYLSKGKDHKKHEFCSKVAIAMRKNSEVIVTAVNFGRNHMMDIRCQRCYLKKGDSRKKI